MQSENQSIKVQKGSYTAVQASNNHVTISQDGHIVMHISCSTRKTEEELLEQIERYAAFAESGFLEKLFQESFPEEEVSHG